MAARKTSGGSALRYVLRHVLRSQGKSLLCLFLSGAFMVGLMFVRVSALRSAAELEHLYTTVTVDMEIMKAQSSVYTGNNGFINYNTVEKLMDTGYISHRYVEGKVEILRMYRLNAAGKRVDKDLYTMSISSAVGIEYPEEFLSQRGIGGEFVFMDGWDEAVFLREWDKKEREPVYPVMISQELYAFFEMEEGDMLEITVQDDFGKVRSTKLTVIGTYPGDMDTVIFPLQVLRNLPGATMRYNRVLLTIDPAQNRRLDEFKEQAAGILSGGGSVELTGLYWDQELRQAVKPIEQVISFMEALYPVTLALSFVVAAGIAILLSLLSAKEAAILRVLGNSKMTCRVILCLQTILPCIVGLVMGHLGAVAMAYLMLPAGEAAGLVLPGLGRAGLYLLYTVLGAVGASAVMTGKNPLELLQVKE